MKWLMKKISNLFHQEEEIIEVEEIIVDESIEEEELQRKIEQAKAKVFQSGTPSKSLEPIIEDISKELDDYKPITPIIGHSGRSRRDVDARISYQYPKGQFRFPVISDDELVHNRRVRNEKAVRQSSQPMRPKAAEMRERSVKQEKTAKAPYQETKKRPFRPTEIPSPIYGFKQRPAILTDSLNPPAEADIAAELMEGLENLPLTAEPSALELPILKKSEPQEVQTEKVPEVEFTASELEDYTEEAPFLEFHHEQGTERPPEEVSPLTEKHAVFEEQEEQAVPVNEIPEPVISMPETELDLDPDSPEAAEPTEAAGPQEGFAADEPPAVMPARKAKTIPFNVVMLKQDKKKLHSNPAASAVSHNRVLPIAAASAQKSEQGARQADTAEEPGQAHYEFPSINLLTPPVQSESDREWLAEQSEILNETLLNFNVRAKVVNIAQGPSVTRFEVQPEPGVKVNKVTNLSDDIKLSMAAKDIRIEAPIPGKHTIGIEIPNRKSKPVFLREVLGSPAFREDPSPMSVALGLDISGGPIVTDLRKMPHGLIAGATGSGKSVCINTMLVSLLYKSTPQELKLLLIDPKMVELAPYNHIPHLVSPVITDVKAATAALKWAVEEMERRYELFAHGGVRDINRYNEKCAQAGQYSQKLPLLLIIIDELADLMMAAPADVEEAICRIAQKARACGIHLILATQRPSVDVITGLIKANIPTRIAFSVSSQIDSRTILDAGGAEKLLGRGDMLFAENGSSKTVRIQGTFVTDDEIDQVVQHVKEQQGPQYLFHQDELMKKTQLNDETDDLFYEACEFVVIQSTASASSLQRRFHIGYNRAARLIEMMQDRGIISEARGSKPRDVLISEEELDYIQNAGTMV
ncbi:DNA translocase FtsK [Peribacillus sp. SCS-37]|uniref:DNA translocase FtsK n=1 Tax=Paraperibacillus esterisolvens TaxID=3115296 RepID=UPI003906CE81